MAAYATQVEDLTRAAERQRMARELHDTLAQGLAGLILQLEAADSHADNGRLDRTQTIVQQAMSAARTILADARRAIDDLRSEDTIQRDLIAKIQDEAERFERSTGISCHLDLSTPPTVPQATSEHLQRIVSESLSNIIRHAQASQVQITLQETSEGLRLVIQDDGSGFDPAPALARPGHFGLIGMRERARLAGGALSIDSQPGQGTQIQLEVPLLATTPADTSHCRLGL